MKQMLLSEKKTNLRDRNKWTFRVKIKVFSIYIIWYYEFLSKKRKSMLFSSVFGHDFFPNFSIDRSSWRCGLTCSDLWANTPNVRVQTAFIFEVIKVTPTHSKLKTKSMFLFKINLKHNFCHQNLIWKNFKYPPSYNNSRCLYVYIFPVPRIVATASNIWENNDIFLF